MTELFLGHRIHIHEHKFLFHSQTMPTAIVKQVKSNEDTFGAGLHLTIAFLLAKNVYSPLL